MSQGVGGPIESVEIAGRPFAVAADAEGNRDIGGFINETQPNGDGTARLVKTRKPWQIDGLSLAIDDLLDEQEYIQGKADEKGFFPINFTFASGVVYGGTGQIVDELKFANSNTTMPVSFSGPGGLAQQ
jgi:hypothetical protein